ncbi:MAG: hypothetical protein ABIR33_02090 [Pyrinomonadaceae bacterium]
MNANPRSIVFVAYMLLLAMPSLAQSDPPPLPSQQNPENPQQEKGSPCPQTQIQSQARTIREGQPVILTARITGGDKNVTPSILWNVSAGSIRDGQGTVRIDVDSTGAGEHRLIEAEVWLGGFPPECAAQSMPYRINIIPPAHKLDEFGMISVNDENERLTRAVAAAQFGNDKVYLIGYAGRTSERMFASTALRRIRDQIIRAGFPGSRVGAYDGGFREQPSFEVWIVPEGADAPKPSPTIDRKDIVYPPVTRTRPAVRKP